MRNSILFISPYNPFCPFPGGASCSGRARIERLSRDADVTLLTFFDARQDTKAIDSLGIKATFAHYTPQANDMGNGWYRLIATISGRLMFFTHIDGMTATLAPLLKELLEKQRFDLIQIDDIIIADLARYLPKTAIKTIFFHNVLTTYFERIRDSKTSIVSRLTATVEWYWIRRFEKAILRFFDAAIVITDSEYLQIRSLSGSIALFKIPLEVDTAAIAPCNDQPDHSSVAFCGTMSYPPNEEAVLYFAAQVLPLIRKKIPEILFYVIGKNPGTAVKKLANDSVIVTGEVVNVRDFLSRSNVVVVPILTGAGMRIKILEAFAMGKPVVSTTLGAEGIAYLDNVDIMIGDTPADFADKVCFLLENREKAEAMGSHARKLAETRYDADLVWKQWQAVYRQLISDNQ